LNIKALCFDLDGTLINVIEGVWIGLNALLLQLEEAGVKLNSRTAYETFVYILLKSRIPHQDIYLCELPHFDAFFREVGIVNERIKEVAIKAYREAALSALQPNPALTKAIEELSKRYVLAVVANGRRERIKLYLTKLGLFSYFSSIISSDEVGYEKPSPLIYEYAIEKLGFRPFEIVMIGDDPVLDIDAANRAGMKTILIRRNYSSEASRPWRQFLGKRGETKPLGIVNNVMEVPRLIRQIVEEPS